MLRPGDEGPTNLHLYKIMILFLEPLPAARFFWLTAVQELGGSEHSICKKSYAGGHNHAALSNRESGTCQALNFVIATLLSS